MTPKGHAIAGGMVALLLAVSGWADTILPTKDITENTNWSTWSDSGSSLQSSPIVDPTQGNVLGLHYDLGYGNWVSIRSPYFSCIYSLAEKGRVLAFDVQGNAGANSDRFQLYLQDTNGHVYHSVTLTAGDPNWETAHIPLDTLLWGGDGSGISLDLRNIVDVGFLITSPSGAPATLALRSMVMQNPPAAAPATLMVDHSDLAACNALNDTLIPLSYSWSTTTTAVAPLPGHAYSRIITSPPDADGGLAEKILIQGQPMNVTPYTHLSFYVRPSPTVNANINAMGVGLQDNVPSDSTRANFLTVSNYQTLVPDTWQRVLIPVTDFAGPTPVSLTALSLFSLTVPADNTVYLGEVTFESLTYTTQPDFVLDDLNENYQASSSSWKTNPSPGTTVTLSSVAAGSSLALQATAGFTQPGQSTAFYRTFGLNVQRYGDNALQFDYMGTGADNNLEFKVEDRNNTVVIFTSPNATNTSGQWKTATVLMNRFTYFSGPVENLDFTDLTNIEFAISRGGGGSGDMRFHRIRSVYSASPAQKLTDQLLPQSPEGSAMPNPFLPALGQTTHIKFNPAAGEVYSIKIFNLHGKQVRVLQGSLDWDGRNNAGRLCEGGVYFYQIEGLNRMLHGKVVLIK